jgi:aldehyde:ferredoxin oxidoreductase
MGSKNLKAIAVYGTKEVPLADDTKVKAVKKEQQATLMASKFVERLAKGGGTSGFTTGMTGQGEAPIKNWAGTVGDMPDASTLSAEKILELREKKYACWRCPIACGGIMKAGSEYNYPAGAHKPEYETEAAFGSLCLNNNLESLVMAGHICNIYGLDTISAGGTIAFAIECYENGIITKEDTGGIELTWGNHKAIVDMTEKMAKREGFGDILADGVKVAAEKIGKGSEQYAMHIGGEEPAMHDPKNSPRFASGYAIDAAPGRHTQGGANEIEGAQQKAKNTYCQAYNATGVCMWAAGMMGEHTVAEMLSAVTGVDYSVEKLLEAGERISNIRQAFNVREGINPMERKFPGRVFGQPPLAEGPTAGKSVDVKPRAVEYFKAMDWDVDTGKPSKEKLIQMGMEDVAAELWP